MKLHIPGRRIDHLLPQWLIPELEVRYCVAIAASEQGVRDYRVWRRDTV